MIDLDGNPKSKLVVFISWDVVGARKRIGVVMAAAVDNNFEFLSLERKVLVDIFVYTFLECI